MININFKSEHKKGINDSELKSLLEISLGERNKLKKVLLIPPDLTRKHSGAGKITGFYYDFLKKNCHVDILPALGTHEPMTKKECLDFFGEGIPYSSIIALNWRSEVVNIGQVPAEYIHKISKGLISESIDVEVNKLLFDKSYDLIISIGQVVPHEVAGMANYSKNIFVGCGGENIINKTHMLGAVYGMERIMGQDHSPVRKVFDYAETKLIQNLPLIYVLTVTTQIKEETVIHGIYIGRDRKLFKEAVKHSQQKNLTFVEKPLKKVVVYLDDTEFKSTWLGNKAIYRTRMAIDDGGELIILAPGVKKFGEDSENDKMIRKYGYIGREKVLNLCNTDEKLKQNLAVAAHLIHGSSEGRFRITYATEEMTREEIEGVNYKYQTYKDAVMKYNPKRLSNGFNILDNGEEIFFINNPALGLWTLSDKLLNKN